MDTQWVSPEVVELTLEEAVERTDMDIACAGTGPETASNDAV